ncbi:hypothetical protein [Gracilibacillus kekensis]|uniref:ABC-2 type transport system permease protein n=1 Tax=Gracilibacillus kekensis TaxID=1027249 RepID=A0A1M7MGU2_9BACI|nr:hypothetical protein [Gracilibacillus kekensis]SHM90049.1 ABC-2 type transport system permease protein [Gracilibacillus kekensis]
MPSKTSYFKKEIWKQSFRTSGWIGIAYFIALIFVLPLQIIMELSSVDQETITYYQENVHHLLYFNGEIQGLLMITAPVLASIFTFRYMQVKGSADFMHSLPIKRSQLFYHQFLLGYLMVIVPAIINALLLLALYGTMDVDHMYQHADIGNWLYFTIMINTLFYTFSVLIGVLTGISTVQAALSYIFLLFPAGISMLIYYNLEMLLIGFSPEYAVGNNLSNLSPFIQVFDIQFRELDIKNFSFYWIISLICIVSSIIIYRGRNVEAANQALAFTILKPVFKIGVTFCFMLLGGTYFGFVQGQFLGWISFGYLFGAFIGYLLAEMLIQKTWRIFHQWKGLLLYIGVSLLVLLSIVFDIYGFEKRIPEPENVESVFITDDSFRFNTYQSGENAKDNANITDPELIKKIIGLHQTILDDEYYEKAHNRNYTEDSQTFFINYYLENGQKINRRYFIPSMSELSHLVEPILESDSFKRSNLAWLYDDISNFHKISLYGFHGNHEIDNQNTMVKIIEALKKDYMNASYEEITQGYFQDLGSIEFEKKPEQFYHVPIVNDYENLKEVLEEEQLNRGIFFGKEDVAMAAVMRTSDNNRELFYDLSRPNEIDDDNLLIIQDREQLDQVYSLWEQETMKGDWEIGLYEVTTNNFITSFRVNEKQLPAFVLENFK